MTAGLSVLSGCAKAQTEEPLFNVEINEEESLPGEETGYNLQEADNKETDIDLGDESKASEDLTESAPLPSCKHPFRSDPTDLIFRNQLQHFIRKKLSVLSGLRGMLYIPKVV